MNKWVSFVPQKCWHTIIIVHECAYLKFLKKIWFIWIVLSLAIMIIRAGGMWCACNWKLHFYINRACLRCSFIKIRKNFRSFFDVIIKNFFFPFAFSITRENCFLILLFKVLYLVTAFRIASSAIVCYIWSVALDSRFNCIFALARN